MRNTVVPYCTSKTALGPMAARDVALGPRRVAALDLRGDGARLLLAASFPTAMASRDDRTAARRELDGIEHPVWTNRLNRAAWRSYLGREPGAADVLRSTVSDPRVTLHRYGLSGRDRSARENEHREGRVGHARAERDAAIHSRNQG